MVSMFHRFLELPRLHKRIISVSADILLLSFSFWAAFTLRSDALYWPVSLRDWSLFAATLVLTLATFVRLGLYRAVIRYMSNHAVLTVLTGVTISALTLIVAGFMLGVKVPRSVPVIYWAIALIFTGGSRLLMRSWIGVLNRSPQERVIIYGAGRTGMQLASALASGGGFKPVLFVDDDPKRVRSIISGLQVFNSAEIGSLIERFNVSRVLLALEEASHAQRSLILRFLEPFQVVVQTVPSMSEIVSGRADIGEFRDLEIEDLLGRDPVVPEQKLLTGCIQNKTVMVTGAGGSIGSELCRQILRGGVRKLVLFDLSEFALYQIDQELSAVIAAENLPVELISLLGSVQKEHRLEVVMRTFGVQTLYHAAAYKHVPMVEYNLVEGVRNNVFGTAYAAEAAIRAGVETFVLISTDKAVRPTNAMGASKRMAELVLQGLAQRQKATRICMVRFGNVLGSSGSVVPLFREQIRKGGPVTVTHPDIYRFFMTIPEAAQLVLQASSMGQGGDVFVLDMGEQVRIADLARKMIRLMGYSVRHEENPQGDIDIVYSGLRPGEKLYEELLIGHSPQPTEHPRIMRALEVSLPWPELEILLQQLDSACHYFDCARVRQLLLTAPLDYQPMGGMEDLVWCQAGRLKLLPDLANESLSEGSNVASFPASARHRAAVGEADA